MEKPPWRTAAGTPAVELVRERGGTGLHAFSSVPPMMHQLPREERPRGAGHQGHRGMSAWRAVRASSIL